MYDGEAEAEEEEGAEAEEEEEGSSDDEADRREFGIYQCLPVAPGAPNWDAACDDVEEYLRRVRWAAGGWRLGKMAVCRPLANANAGFCCACCPLRHQRRTAAPACRPPVQV